MGKSVQENFDGLISEPDETMRLIVRHVSAGGTLPGLCDLLGVRYADVVHWIIDDKERNNKYSAAVDARAEWSKETVFEELRRIGVSRITEFFDESGSMKPINQWTSEMKGLIKEIKYNDDGEIKEVKFWNKEKALELLGKNMEMFKETHTVQGKFSLEDLIQASREDDPK